MLRKRIPLGLLHPTHCSMQVQLPRRTDGVECRVFLRFWRGGCPETPRRFDARGVPKRPTEFATTCQLFDIGHQCS